MPSTLYGARSDFNDVTSGSNGTCSTAYLCNAGTGYDGPTGLGTPADITPFQLSSARAQPTVSIASPANGATVSGSVAVSANASDSAGVSSVQFSVDGMLEATSTSAPYDWNWDTSSVSAGSHTISATAIDAAGNRATTQISVNVVHNTAPPPTPSGLKLAVAGTTQVAIFWSPSSDTSVVVNDVYRDGIKIGRANRAELPRLGARPGDQPHLLGAGRRRRRQHLVRLLEPQHQDREHVVTENGHGGRRRLHRTRRASGKRRGQAERQWCFQEREDQLERGLPVRVAGASPVHADDHTACDGNRLQHHSAIPRGECRGRGDRGSHDERLSREPLRSSCSDR